MEHTDGGNPFRSAGPGSFNHNNSVKEMK